MNNRGRFFLLAMGMSVISGALSADTNQTNTQQCDKISARYAKPCTCAEINQIGTCAAGAVKVDQKTREYYCDCIEQPAKKQQADSSSSKAQADKDQTKDARFTFTWSSEKRGGGVRIESNGETIISGGFSLTNAANAIAPGKRHVFIFSQDIDAPIYNIPLQRALVPLSHNAICKFPWFFSVAPYGKTKQTQEIKAHDIHLSNIEGGALMQAGYYGSWWFANCIADLGGTKTDATIGEDYTSSAFRFRFRDVLFGLGLKTDSRDADWSANGEWFFGLSGNKLGGHADKMLVPKKIFNVGNPSTGVQADVNWTFAAFKNCKFGLSAFSRFTHFFSKNIEHEQENIAYTPGSYVDLLLGFTQYYGSNYQHPVEIGYNPTVQVIKAKAAVDEADAANLVALLNGHESGDVRHNVYATYSYNLDSHMPMFVSVGASATIVPHSNTYGTVFGTFGLAF